MMQLEENICRISSFQLLKENFKKHINPSQKILAGVISSSRSSPEQFREIARIIVELFQDV